MTTKSARKGFTITNPRFIWALAYIAVNLIAFCYIALTGMLMGDGQSLPATDTVRLFFATFSVIGSILLILSYFNWCHELRISVPHLPTPKSPLAIFYILLLIFFIVYVAVTGLFVAGSSQRGGSVVSAFFVIFNVDALFCLVFAVCRDSKYYRYIAPLYFISIIQRGWFGLIFTFIILESFRFLRAGLLRWWHVVGIGLLFAAYPIIDAAKVYIRINDGFDLAGFIEFVVSAAQVVDASSQASLAIAFEKVIGRLQTVSHAYIVFDNQFYFDAMRVRGIAGDFWSEGIFGVIADILTSSVRLQESAQTLAQLIAPDLESSWNVNPSFIGWLGIHGAMAPLAALYVAVLAFVSHLLMKTVADTETGRDVLWYTWLVLIVPGWIAQFASFIWGLGVFIGLVWALGVAERLTRPSRLRAAVNGSALRTTL
jgi:hypothetical protein